MIVVRCMLIFTGEEIKLYDSGEEVCSSSNYKRTEVTETALSGENCPHCNTSTSVNPHTISITVCKENWPPM